MSWDGEREAMTAGLADARKVIDHAMRIRHGLGAFERELVEAAEILDDAVGVLLEKAQQAEERVSVLTDALDRALGLAHFDTLDGRTYAECLAIRNEARAARSVREETPQ